MSLTLSSAVISAPAPPMRVLTQPGLRKRSDAARLGLAARGSSTPCSARPLTSDTEPSRRHCRRCCPCRWRLRSSCRSRTCCGSSVLRELVGRDGVDHHHGLPVARILRAIGVHRVIGSGIGDEELERGIDAACKGSDRVGVGKIERLDPDAEIVEFVGSNGAQSRSRPSRRSNIDARTRGRCRDSRR